MIDMHGKQSFPLPFPMTVITTLAALQSAANRERKRKRDDRDSERPIFCVETHACSWKARRARARERHTPPSLLSAHGNDKRGSFQFSRGTMPCATHNTTFFFKLRSNKERTEKKQEEDQSSSFVSVCLQVPRHIDVDVIKCLWRACRIASTCFLRQAHQ